MEAYVSSVVERLAAEYDPEYLSRRESTLNKVFGTSSSVEETYDGDLEMLRQAHGTGSDAVMYLTYLDRIHSAHRGGGGGRMVSLVRRFLMFVLKAPTSDDEALHHATASIQRPHVLQGRPIRSLFVKEGRPVAAFDKVPVPYNAYVHQTKALGLPTEPALNETAMKTFDLDYKTQRLILTLGTDFILRVRHHLQLEVQTRFSHLHPLSWRTGLPCTLTIPELVHHLFAQQKTGELARQLYMHSR